MRPGIDLAAEYAAREAADFGEVLYVGDHPANDVFPDRAAGLRTAHIRRGPWGHLWADDPQVRDAADWSIRTLPA